MSVYKHKYLKYKYKYLQLKGGYEMAPDYVEPDEDDIKVVNIGVPEPVYPHIETLPDSEVDVYTEEPDDPEDLKLNVPKYYLEPFDLGAFGLARLVIRDLQDYSDTDFIYFSTVSSDKSKLLLIKDLDAFDNFTEYYGFINNGSLYISWDKVSRKYKGLYVHPSLLSERLEDAYYKGATYASWWSNEYLMQDKSIISKPIEFIKAATPLSSKKISHPFKATVHTETEFSKSAGDYIGVVEKPDKSKILILTDTMSFDRFTNKYSKSKSKSKSPSIDWKRVAKDYRGVYIDKDQGVELARYRRDTLPSRGSRSKHKIPSWWKRDDLKRGVVYIFNKN